ncbi:hypothetical protein [Streptomyces sp. IB2014 016-6]|uniref:hypothetical protein n=1 Tax=Streptomyces sp. IB2014 016-6 TaxID=2517818 RepID=UPI0011CB23A0|nr:hypothetical protein [Streptomyces sp. IB2014 016-6]TXL84204.1 hypothetical protein EW053_35200 [Streptomyces sp. IB2014 016-6]
MRAGQQPAFGLSFDPRALTDLLQAPGDIRDLALAQLQDVVHAELVGRKLTGDLSGYRKLGLDYRNQWRLVYALRPAPAAAAHRMEIRVVAVRPRAGNDVYDTVGRRLGMARRPLSARTHAARSAPPQLLARGPVPKPGPPPHAAPGPAHSTPFPTVKGSVR